MTKIRITLEVDVDLRNYRFLSQASNRAEMIRALKEEHIINDLIVPDLKTGHGIRDISFVDDSDERR